MPRPILILLEAALIVIPAVTHAASPASDEMAVAHRWVVAVLGGAQPPDKSPGGIHLPSVAEPAFSFLCGSQPSVQSLKTWESKLSLGDYYPLTPYSLAADAWIARQFDRPDLGTGVVQAFRRAASPYESVRLKLRGLAPDERYEVADRDAAGSAEVSGRDLMESGLSVALQDQPGSVILTYRRKGVAPGCRVRRVLLSQGKRPACPPGTRQASRSSLRSPR